MRVLITISILFISLLSFSQGNSCATATALTQDGCTNGTDNGFCSWTLTGGGIVDPTCGGPYIDGEGWYTITTSATATRWVFEVKQATGGGSNPINNPAFQLYSGVCGSLTEISCYDNDNGTGVNEMESLPLSPSTTYYIRVVDSDGDMKCVGGGRNYQYSACFWDYEDGDDCDNAIPVILSSSCGYVIYDNNGHIDSDEVDASCAAGANAEDVWFVFTTGIDGTVAVDLRPLGITDSGLEIYAGTCGNLISLGCSDDKGLIPTYPNGLMSRLMGTLAPSTQYYARIWAYLGGTGTFEVCFREMPQPLNDKCATQIPLTIGTNYTMTNWGTTPAIMEDPLASACNGSLDNSAWFTFTTSISGDYTISITNIECSQGTGLQVDIGSWGGPVCTSGNWVSENCKNPYNCNDINIIATGLLPATTYYIFVDGWGAVQEFADFDIRVTPPASLPIELVEFNCEILFNNVEVSWTVASQVNNDYYVVEHSLDAYEWNTITTVDGAGNSNQLMSYSIIHENPINGINYYRLTQVDFDGQSETFYPVVCDKTVNERVDEVLYYNYLGQNIVEPTSGLYIRHTTYSNGTTIIDKVYLEK